MKRLTITIEDYDDSKVINATPIAPEEVSVTSSVLKRSGVAFAIDDVEGPLFNYRLDDKKSFVELQLRTKAEINGWIANEIYAEIVWTFLASGKSTLRLSLDAENAFLEISRQN